MKGDSVVKEIQIKNFRSLKDTGSQKISPITVLVGENSSGKSTFLRAFPLLKQSISKRTSGPILWAGDVDDYVDFGSFRETVCNDGSDEITFRFKFNLETPGFHRRHYTINKSMKPGQRGPVIDKVDYSIVIQSSNGLDYVSKCIIILNGSKIEIDVRSESISVDGTSIDLYNNIKKTPSKSQNNRQYGIYFRSFSRTFGFSLPDIVPLWDNILNTLDLDTEDPLFSPSFILESIMDLGEMLPLIPNIPLITNNSHRIRGDINNQKLYNLLAETFNRPDMRDISNAAKVLYLYMILDSIDDYIYTYFRNVHYIAPLRATAERYYRLRNLAVDEVDFQGKNMAIFINSLPRKRKEDFEKWTNKYFGFSVVAGASEGHISLKVKLEGSDKAINLSDTGFGYSQALPIITQLWELSTRGEDLRRMRGIYDEDTPLVIAIEQPELHLHPAVQAKLAKAFIACIDLARQNHQELQIILETHSETIINSFGRAISKGKLNKDDISIILFEKNLGQGITTVRNSGYDEYGYLLEWPYGFFDAEE